MLLAIVEDESVAAAKGGASFWERLDREWAEGEVFAGSTFWADRGSHSVLFHANIDAGNAFAVFRVGMKGLAKGRPRESFDEPRQAEGNASIVPSDEGSWVERDARADHLGALFVRHVPEGLGVHDASPIFAAIVSLSVAG